jgi:hypothetical protein
MKRSKEAAIGMKIFKTNEDWLWTPLILLVICVCLVFLLGCFDNGDGFLLFLFCCLVVFEGFAEEKFVFMESYREFAGWNWMRNSWIIWWIGVNFYLGFITSKLYLETLVETLQKIWWFLNETSKTLHGKCSYMKCPSLDSTINTFYANSSKTTKNSIKVSIDFLTQFVHLQFEIPLKTQSSSQPLSKQFN